MTSLAVALLLTGCAMDPMGPVDASVSADDTGEAAWQAPASSDPPRRVLLILADDLGVESLAAYEDLSPSGAAPRSFAPTPTIDALCDDGVRFTEAWANPTCSPSRASMLTGRFAARTGVGHAVPLNGRGLGADEPTVPRWLASHAETSVATALVGKWHLGATDETGGRLTPNGFGWGHYAGPLENSVGDYFWWERTVDGEAAFTDVYATTSQIDDALQWVGDRSADESWLMWLNLAAPHEPLHAPPEHLHSYGPMSVERADIAADPLPYFQASLEAADTELGRLLDALDSRGMGDVDVIFVGDNGSSGLIVQAPWRSDQAKETLYEGGVRVPLCVSGPSVSEGGRSSPALVNLTDIFATTGDLFGLDPEADLPDTHTFDTVSFASVLRDPAAAGLRAWNYTDGFGGHLPDGQGAAVRDDRYKVVSWDDGRSAAFDLVADPLETTDLLTAAVVSDETEARLDGLVRQLDAITADTGR